MLVEQLASAFFSKLTFRIKTGEKKIYLTFDDGPSPETTPWVLDELKKSEASATFFCVGAQVEKHPEIFNEIVEQGHAVGNHTMHHLNGWKSSVSDYLVDVKQCEDVLLRESRIKNQESSLFRPPYGKLTPAQYSVLKKNYNLVMWDVLTRDFDSGISPDKCLHRVITKSKRGSIVVFHDSVKAEKKLWYVLPRVLEYFSERNFSFDSLPN